MPQRHWSAPRGNIMLAPDPRIRPLTVAAAPCCGTLSITMVAHAQDRGNPRFQDVLLHDRFDADEDGRLDRTERDLARAEASSKPQCRRRGGPPGDRGGADAPRPETRENALRIDPDDLDAAPRLEGVGLYDRDVLHTIFLQFPEDDWHLEMVAFHGTDVEVPAMLRLDGRVVGEVGVSYRGNPSFDMPAKKSFGISIDAYDDDLRIDGHRTLNLLNANGDTSMMREVLFSNIAGEYVPAPKANFVRVVVNGIYLGVCANVEQINKDSRSITTAPRRACDGRSRRTSPAVARSRTTDPIETNTPGVTS